MRFPRQQVYFARDAYQALQNRVIGELNARLRPEGAEPIRVKASPLDNATPYSLGETLVEFIRALDLASGSDDPGQPMVMLRRGAYVEVGRDCMGELEMVVANAPRPDLSAWERDYARPMREHLTVVGKWFAEIECVEGVSLMDMCLAMNEGSPDLAKKMKRSIWNSREYRRQLPPPIGRDPEDPRGRTQLYSMLALCEFAEKYCDPKTCAQVELKSKLSKRARVAYLIRENKKN